MGLGAAVHFNDRARLSARPPKLRPGFPRASAVAAVALNLIRLFNRPLSPSPSHPALQLFSPPSPRLPFVRIELPAAAPRGATVFTVGKRPQKSAAFLLAIRITLI